MPAAARSANEGSGMAVANALAAGSGDGDCVVIAFVGFADGVSGGGEIEMVALVLGLELGLTALLVLHEARMTATRTIALDTESRMRRYS